MKNTRTPRTLADSQFTTGYSRAELLQREAWANRWLYRIAAVAFAVIAVSLIVEKMA